MIMGMTMTVSMAVAMAVILVGSMISIPLWRGSWLMVVLADDVHVIGGD